MKTTSLFTFFLIAFSSVISLAQTTNKSDLKINEIMKGKDFIGHWPENHFWSAQGNQIHFSWNPKAKLLNDNYSYSIELRKTFTSLDSAHIFPIPFDFEQNTFKEQYFIRNGNLWVWHKKEKKANEVLSVSASISQVTRLKNPSEIAFRQGLNLFKYNTTSGSIQQLTFFTQEKSPNIPANKEEDLLSKQQERLFLYIQEKKELEETLKSKRDAKKANKPFYLEGTNLDFVEISKDGLFVFFAMAEYPKNKSTHVNHLISEDGYTYSQNARPKVGEEEPKHSFYIYSLAKDTVVKIDFSTLPNIRYKPLYFMEYGDTARLYTQDKKIVFHDPICSFGSYTAMDIRSYDNKERWIVQIDCKNFSYQLIDHQHDEAWIGGPGISSWNTARGTLGFWNEDKNLFFQSEKTGYSHLYSYDFSTQFISQLTQGQFEIHDVKLAKDKQSFYLTANKKHPGNREFYKFSPKNKEWKPILTSDGNYMVEISPDEKNLAVLYSTKNKPWELFIAKNTENTELKQLTSSTTPSYKNYPWMDPTVVTFKGKDSTDVFARLYAPKKADENKAAVIFVHGAGYLQNAHNYWSSYYREYMFHNLLVDNGYAVLDIDFRASEGYGRDHRTAIYRHMGKRDLEDQISGKQFLVEKLNIDKDRVGIYGGSYGGFITLMALLTTPEEFACGAALRSVTDWMQYNHEYTSNILNYPNTDSIAYYRSSPINFAENLNKPLLMLHGMVDDNVQFQDIVRLSQRFIELEKTDWNLAAYPIEGHGFTKSYSWNDEYRRIFELFQSKIGK